MSLAESAPRCGLDALAESVAEELSRAREEVLGLLKERGGRAGDRGLRLLLTERLSAAAGRIVALLEREMEQYRRQLKRQERLLEAVLSPVVRLNRTDSIGSCSLRPGDENQPQGSEVDPAPPTASTLPSSTSSDAAESSDSDKDWEDVDASCDKEVNRRDTDEGRRSTHQRPRGPPPSHPCIICGKTFRHRGNLVKHAESHVHNPECLCGVCGERFDSSDGLLDHLRSHRDAASSGGSCEVCGKTFQNMETHMRSHTGVKPFTCDTCGKSFPRPGALRRHKKIHGRTPTHPCHVCGQTFSEDQQLQDHLKTHNEDKRDGSDTDGGSEMDSKRDKGFTSSLKQTLPCCKVCGDSFHSQGFLRKHAETHCRETRNICGVCGEQVDSSDDLLSHLQAHRETGGTCSICGKTFQNMETHMRSHTGIKPYRCTVCNKHFPRPGALRRHKKIHTGERPYACRHCGKAFIESSALKMHSKSHSWELDKSPSPDSDAERASAVKENAKEPQVAPHCCKVCQESFQNKSSLRKHAESHVEAAVCGVCGEPRQPSETLTDHLQTHRDAGKICHICGRTYQNIKTHMRSHTGVKPYHCGVCGKSFPRPGALRRHKKIHSGERPYICEFCGKTFIDNGALRTHLRNHTGDKPVHRVSCETCGKSLASLHVLEVHKRIHTGEKPFLCRVCGKAFRQVGGLNAHMLTHTGEKPFSCSLCSKSFSTKGYLDTHIRFHKKERAFSCHLCWKAFVTKNDLKKHLLTHTGEKPYSCRVCGKSYQEKRSRDVHMKVHFGARLGKEPIRRQDDLQPDFLQL